ncbi:MAG TPA: type II toxin-antitoxin system prevent-host-death family antitoxin [Xanthobacteraceae bacterium]|jgi:prevent-host-death family protein|nr:type II toxin-antitoxin system prevent-host-death family antitoxin [Xanthobacteraceae bacterium]
MNKAISAADANRNFSRVLRDVRQGLSYVVTAHGKPVAKIVPLAEGEDERTEARKLLMARLQRQKVRDIGPWTRDELHEEGE